MTETELSAIEREFGWRLPAAYRVFLLQHSSNSTRDRLHDLDFATYRLSANREFADYLLKVSKADYRLDPSDVVFFHQGYQFLFFRCDHNDDPPVFRFSEGKPAPNEVASSFSSWCAGFRPQAAGVSVDRE